MAYFVIGLMSGTSLDGLDVALCRFSERNNKWNYKISCAKTYPYPKLWKEKLLNASNLQACDFVKLHNEYGRYTGGLINKFISEHTKVFSKLTVNFIASHGHTVFHQPQNLMTFQLGNGASIAAVSGMPVISDFRTLDIALGGQGAPLVPIGDDLLFNDMDYCLNLGGFANISFNKNKKRIAFDVCPVNIVINELVHSKNMEFDKNGNIAKTGRLNPSLLKELNGLDYYHCRPPKSLGKEWVDAEFLPVVTKYKIPLEDKLRSIYEHVAIQVSKVCPPVKNGNLLLTGGGAHNTFLTGLLREKVKNHIHIPDKLTIDFKEALIFAFLGLLRFRNENNCLTSVTGAKRDNCGGSIFHI